MELKSSAFTQGANIPRKHTCDAEDVSPLLRWDNVPPGTKAFALIADDPDAPVGTWVHWVIYDLPAETKELAEGTAKTETLEHGATGNERLSAGRLRRAMPSSGLTSPVFI